MSSKSKRRWQVGFRAITKVGITHMVSKEENREQNEISYIGILLKTLSTAQLIFGVALRQASPVSSKNLERARVQIDTHIPYTSNSKLINITFFLSSRSK